MPVESLGRVRVAKNFNPRSPQSRRDLASILRTRRDPPERRAPPHPPQQRRGRRGHALCGRAARASRARLPRPGGPPPLGRARREAPPRDERAGAPRRDADQLDRPHLRPGLPAAGGAGVPDPRRAPGAVRGPGVQNGARRTSRSPTQGACSRGSTPSPTCSPRSACGAATWDELRPPGSRRRRLGAGLPVAQRRAGRAPPARRAGGRGPRWPRPCGCGPGCPEAEAEHRLDFLPEPDAGFAWAAHQWAAGVSLDRVLGDTLAAGDFVRWTRQLIDLLDQIAKVADRPCDGRRARPSTGCAAASSPTRTIRRRSPELAHPARRPIRGCTG